MSQTKVPNLCGASAEFNAIQTKFDDMISDAIAGIEDDASTLVAKIDTAFGFLITELRTLIPDLPALPDVNLQALVTSLSSLTEGTSEYIALLADITTKFETDLTAAGYTLDTLVTAALAEIQGGGDGCSVVPNFVRDAAGLKGVSWKSLNSLMPEDKSVGETVSKLVKNLEVVEQSTGLGLRVKKMIPEPSTAVDVVAGTVTNDEPPTSDTGAFTVTETTRGFRFGLNTIKVTTPASQDGKNITSGGFARRKTRAKERFKESDVTQSGDTWTIKLAHSPVGVGTLKGNCLITRGSKEIQAMIHVTPKGEPNALNIGNRNQGKAYYEVDGQTIKITGKGHDFFPHSDQHETYFHNYLEDIQFHVSYDYFANYDPNFVKLS